MRTKTSIYVNQFVLCCTLLAVSLGSGCGGSDAHPVFDTVSAAKLQASLDSSVIDLEIPGAVLAVRSPNGAVWIGTSGYGQIGAAVSANDAQYSTDVAMSSEMHFHIGSITKTFTATIILQLIDEGKISLHDTIDQVIQKWLPNYFDFTIPYRDTITIRNLLEMRSGMGNYSSDSKYMRDININPLAKLDPKTLIRYGVESEDTPAYPPGTRSEYNNGNYILLGIFIEKITGNTYNDEVSERIIKPLNLKNTSVPSGPSMPDPYAHGYKYSNTDNELVDLSTATDPSWGWAAGSIISTVSDLLTWAEALVEGTLISSTMQQERMMMFEIDIDDFSGISYGLGIYSDNGAIGHGGDYSGFYTGYVVRYKNYDFAVLLNGKLQQTRAAVRVPARNVFWNAAQAIGLDGFINASINCCSRNGGMGSGLGN